jgi:orotate phosphoribosyltransferase
VSSIGEEPPAQDEGLLKEIGALLQGHFLLTSGRHSSSYLEKFRILEHPHHTQRLCARIVGHFRALGPQLVAGPTTGGIILAFEVARQLGVRAVYAEREGEGRVFRRGFHISPGEEVLVVDDIVTTGGSVRQVLEEVRRRGGRPVGVGVLVDRNSEPLDFSVPFFSCFRLPLPSYSAEECPLCRRGEPLTKPGGG